MRYTTWFIIISLSLLMGACDFWKGELEIDIGDYENQLNGWNNQNMLDYQLRVNNSYKSNVEEALIIVKNDIPESSDPSSWLEYKRLSTIPEFYSYIKELERDIRDEYKSGNSSYSLEVMYDTVYHYPRYIAFEKNGYSENLFITLTPLEEGELEIDIGDYENQLNGWNNQNMLDYQLEVYYTHGYYDYDSNGINYIINVKNGIPDSIDLNKDIRNKKTIPDIYFFIKEEEGRMENVYDAYNGLNRSYLNVQYNIEYHYPTQISSGVGYLFGSYEHWEIILTPVGEMDK